MLPTYSKMNKKNSLLHRLRIKCERWRLEAGVSLWTLVFITAIGICGPLTLLVFWLRPELLGYQYYMVFSNPDCFVVQPGFKTGGNANRMEALYYAFHLATERKFRYIAVPSDWQEWLCKIYSAESINDFPVPVIPVGTGKGCPVAFYPLYQKQLRDPVNDICEEWHLANFFRIPWYSGHRNYNYSWWRYFLPTGKTYQADAREKMRLLRMAHPDKKIVTVHKRWLSVWCYKNVEPESIPPSNTVEKYCHMTPSMVVALVEEAGLSMEGVHIVVSSDGYLPKEDALFSSFEFEAEETSFMTQVWMWATSDLHIGHPNSTIDAMACRFKRLLVEENLHCLPQSLKRTSLEGVEKL